jgi:hypothetical protein
MCGSPCSVSAKYHVDQLHEAAAPSLTSDLLSIHLDHPVPPNAEFRLAFGPKRARIATKLCIATSPRVAPLP